MSELFAVTTVAIIYNEKRELLVVKRSEQEDQRPGIYAYPGGKLEYANEMDLEVLEHNLMREVKEEVGVDVANCEYVSSHTFTKDNGEKALVVAFLAEYESGEPQALIGEEVEEVAWLPISEIRELDTLEVVKEVYEDAYNYLYKNDRIHHLAVAGLVLNEQGEFLLVKEFAVGEQVNDYYIYPWGEVVNLPGNSWEVLETNLYNSIKEQTNVEIHDGAIPFTDQALMTTDGRDKITQFFICRYKSGPAQIMDNTKITEIVWKKFEDFNQDEMLPYVYKVFERATAFINSLNQ